MSSSTERLYFEDPLALEFEGTVALESAFGGRRTLVLDRSAFFPEGGGQLGDHGTLDAGGTRLVVSDVQVDDTGVVHHVLEEGASTLVPGTTVKGAIDRARRRLHMALHTGQHILSAAFVEVANAPTVSARLGETGCTVDLGGMAPDEAIVARAEGLANSVIDDDMTVRAYFPSAEELETLKMRRKAKVERDVRVVVIGDFDVSPCGGTHCTRSAQVGLIAVTSVERYKGGTRVTFASGQRARSELGRDAGALRALSRDLSCGVSDVPQAIDKLRRELQSSREAFGRARGEIAVRLGDELAREATGAHVVGVLDDPEMLRAVASRITAAGDRVAILAAPTEDGMRVLVSRSAASAFDCGAFLKKLTSSAGGRGGGRAEHAEGKLPKEVAFRELVAASEPL